MTMSTKKIVALFLLVALANAATAASFIRSMQDHLHGSPTYDEMVYDEEMRCVRIARRRLAATTYDSRPLEDRREAEVRPLRLGEMFPCPNFARSQLDPEKVADGSYGTVSCWFCPACNPKGEKTALRYYAKGKTSYDCNRCNDMRRVEKCGAALSVDVCDLCRGEGEIPFPPALRKNKARYLGTWNVQEHSRWKRNQARFFFFNERTEELVWFKPTVEGAYQDGNKGEKLKLRDAEITKAVSKYTKENKWEDKSGRWVIVTDSAGTTKLELAHVNSHFFDWSGDKKDTQDIYDKLKLIHTNLTRVSTQDTGKLIQMPAMDKHTGDVAHLHKDGMKLSVSGAGTAQANGWYRRRENSEGPPKAWNSGCDFWIRSTEGRPWYEKYDGCFIWFNGSTWELATHDGRCYQSPAETPLDGRWEISFGEAPAPTLRVVS